MLVVSDLDELGVPDNDGPFPKDKMGDDSRE